MPAISFASVAIMAGVAAAAGAVGATVGARMAARPAGDAAATPAVAPEPVAQTAPPVADAGVWEEDTQNDVAELVTDLEDIDGILPEDTLDSGAIAAARGMKRQPVFAEMPTNADDEDEEGDHERTVLYSEETWRAHMEDLRE